MQSVLEGDVRRSIKLESFWKEGAQPPVARRRRHSARHIQWSDFEGEKEIKWRENLSLSLLVSTHENSSRSNAPRSPSLSRRIKRIGPSLTPRVAARLANAVKQ